jgi:hypothetical protein
MYKRFEVRKLGILVIVRILNPLSMFCGIEYFHSQNAKDEETDGK